MERPPLLSVDEVRRVAHLARLRPSDDEIERYRAQMAAILEHVAQLQELDVDGVEPLTHPTLASQPINRLDADEAGEPMDFAGFERNAPAMEGRCLAVPKVIGDNAEGS